MINTNILDNIEYLKKASELLEARAEGNKEITSDDVKEALGFGRS